MEVPTWKRIVDELSGPLLTAVDPVLKRKESPNLNASLIPHLALYHLLACLSWARCEPYPGGEVCEPPSPVRPWSED